LRDELGLPRDVVLVGTVGAFEQRKGHDYLIRALGVLRREHIPVGAVICGGPGDYRKWQILAKKEGVEDRVFFFRNFSESQLTRLHHALDIYANLSNMSRSCGLDLALLEAMSAGLPVVVFDHGALPHAVPSGENGIVVPTRDTGALSSAIRRLAAMSREERMRMGEKSAAFAKQYDIHAMAKTKLEWFEEVIANRDSS
jgi:glycosyltransferase involved in cell wall biosynthesis